MAAVLSEKVQLQLKAGEFTDKADATPVTIADYGAQALVIWSLRRSLPDATFSVVAEEDAGDLREPGGEEMAARITELVNAVLSVEAGAPALSSEEVLDLIDLGDSAGGSQGRHWVLDPIDGTRGFVGMRQYAVCLALLDAGQVVVGVLGCPNLPMEPITDADAAAGAAERVGQAGVGALFSATLGGGAFVGPLKEGGQPLQRLALEDSADFGEARFMESYESKQSDHSFAGRLAAVVGVTRPPLRVDSAAKYGALARGDAAMNLRFPHAGYRDKIWDHAAGALIAAEAGAVISDVGGKPLDFGNGRWLDMDRGIVTAPPALHAALLAAIQDLAPAS
ncbi:hypothetical protein WJX81_003131 [Elliptochloris bilobata]|uniref:3'(2'),5'-bisphosphate nucleotidase n=1 Tax=Elliptochloris bilobata TaxID=381761 RepID=A0AAW1QVS6_9CHLO